MAKYIDAEALKRELFKVAITDDLYGMGVASGIDIAVEKLKATPAADVVEIVRCKHCYKRATEDCPMDDGWTANTIFCSYGERKEK